MLGCVGGGCVCVCVCGFSMYVVCYFMPRDLLEMAVYKSLIDMIYVRVGVYMYVKVAFLIKYSEPLEM